MSPDPKVLAQTYAAAFPDTRPWTAAEITTLLAGKGVTCIGDGACFVIVRTTLDEAEILTLATHPTQRRQGRAQQALLDLEEKIRGTTKSIFLEVDEGNSAARALYHTCDYRQIGLRRGYYTHADKPPTNALVLRKNLT